MREKLHYRVELDGDRRQMWLRIGEGIRAPITAEQADLLARALIEASVCIRGDERAAASGDELALDQYRMEREE